MSRFLVTMDCWQVDIMQQCVNLQLETGQHNHEVRFFATKTKLETQRVDQV